MKRTILAITKTLAILKRTLSNNKKFGTRKNLKEITCAQLETFYEKTMSQSNVTSINAIFQNLSTALHSMNLCLPDSFDELHT